MCSLTSFSLGPVKCLKYLGSFEEGIVPAREQTIGKWSEISAKHIPIWWISQGVRIDVINKRCGKLFWYLWLSKDIHVLRCCSLHISLLAEVSHDEAKWNDRRETSAGFRRVVWWSRRPNFWSKLTGFQNQFRLICNARALLDCTLTIIEPTVDYGFHEICEIRNFSLINRLFLRLAV